MEIKVTLEQDRLPGSWYNILHDLPEPLPPPLDPGTMKPISPEPLMRLLSKECVRQEVSTEEFIPIPEEYGRPTCGWDDLAPYTARPGWRRR